MTVGRALKIRVNFTKTTLPKLFSLENSFQQKLLSSSVIQYKAMDVEFIIVENAKLNVINSNNRMKQSVKV